jgi:sentrin-specific protease 8
MPTNASKVVCKDSDLILNYHDAVVYGSDLKILQSRTEWLNDACIHFFFNLLQLSEETHQDLYMDPSVLSFFMHQCTDEEDMEDFVTNTKFPETGRIFIPVNDKMALSSAWQQPHSGNHWSLLVVTTSKKDSFQFWHFDSVHGSGNSQAAQDVVDKMSQQVFHQGATQLIQASTPQQANGYDCGVHVLAASKQFSAMAGIQQLEVYETTLREYVQKTPDFCWELRNWVASQILRLAAEK